MYSYGLLLACLGPKTALDISGSFLEGCSCAGLCSFETAGKIPGCHGLGGYRIDRGTFGSQDISGSRVAYVTTPDDRLYIFVDAPNSKKRGLVEALGRKLFADGFGKLKAVQPAKIWIGKSAGDYRMSIRALETGDLSVHPLVAPGGHGVVELKNVFGDPYDNLFAAQIKSASFTGGGSDFKLSKTSAFYLPKFRIRKKI